MLSSVETTEVLLTHLLVPAGPIPTVQDPDGLYPYESYCETSRRPVLKAYRMVVMENAHVRVKICPDLGGRVCSLFLKKAGKETLYFPNVVRPVRILPRQSFTGGGIELSFPISHSPVETAAVAFEVKRAGDRIYVCCGEREVRFGMSWTVEYSLGEEDEFLTQRTVFLNGDNEAHPWMSWSNAGVPAREDTEFAFPDGPVLMHRAELRTIDWKADGPRRQSDVRRMTGYFWKAPDVCAFGAFTPSLGAGLYHVADAAEMPGIKLWSDGVGRDEAWVSQYTLNGEQCLEIQAGPLVDQSVKDVLEPGQTRAHVEYWIPSAARLDIRELTVPYVELRSVEDVPMFGWARGEDVADWLQLLTAWKERPAGDLPRAPRVESNRWAVSGMAELGVALAWAAASTEGCERDRWLLQHGAWLAGRGETDAAMEVLAQSGDDRARALCGRLWMVHRKDARAAAGCFRGIESEAVALHPQVVVERDRVLGELGEEALQERRRWLDAVLELEDEWVAERRADMLNESGEPQAALDVLRRTRFQLVHQRYERTRLLRRIEAKLGLEHEAFPAWLGEDDLAEFGAYREHAEVQ